MKQRVFFLHSAGPQGIHEGSSDFIDWLTRSLGSHYEIIHPLMPHPEDPDYEPWKAALHQAISKLDGEVIFIGHSLGAAVLLKYLTEEKIKAQVKSMHLCAAPFWGADADWQYEPFTLEEKFASRLPEIPRLFMYHSKNDPYVPYAHAEHYKQALPQSVLRTLDGDSHVFTAGLPQLLQDIRAGEKS